MGKHTTVAIPVEVDSDAEAQEHCQALSDAKRSYRNAADFYSKQGDHEKALALITTALELDPENWYTNWVKLKFLQLQVTSTARSEEKGHRYGAARLR